MKKVFYSLMVAAGLVALTPVVLAASGSSGDGDVNIPTEETPTDPEGDAEDSADEPETGAVEYVALIDYNFRDASQFAIDTRVSVASLTEEFDTIPGGVMLYKSTQEEFSGLVFQPARNDAANSWWVRQRNTNTDWGLASVNDERAFAIQEVHAGYRVTIEAKNALVPVDSTMVAETIDNDGTLCGQGVSQTFVIAKDGMLAFKNNGNYMYLIRVEAPIVATITEMDYNFRDVEQFPIDTRVQVASLTIEYDTISGGVMLYESTQEEFSGLVFQPARNDAANSWWVRQRNTNTDWGLASVNDERAFGIKDLKAGTKVTIEAKNYLAPVDSTVTSSIVQNESTACGYGVSYTYTLAKDGFLAFKNNGNYMYAIKVEKPVYFFDASEMNFRDVEQFPLDTRVTVASLTIEHDTIAGGVMLYESTQEEFAGLAFQPARNDAANSWWVRQRNTNTDWGLASVNDERAFAVVNLKAGEIVTIEAKNYLAPVDSTMVSAIVENEGTQCGYGVSYTYTMAKPGMLAFKNNGNYMYIINIQKFGGQLAPATIKEEGQDYDIKTVSIACADAAAQIYYTLDGGEAILYTEPFQLETTTKVSAWTELNDDKTAPTNKNIVAGYIPTPTSSITKVNNLDRTVVLADAVTDAKIVYTANGGDETVYDAPLVISETTSYSVVASRVSSIDPSKTFTSEAHAATYEAGTMVQLNAPVFTIHQIEDSAKAAYFAEHNLVAYDVIANQSSVLCNPTASTTIDAYYVTPDYKDTIVLGTFATPAVIDSIPYGGVFAVAKAEGYATSAESHVYNKPALELTPVWEINFQDSILKMTEGAYYSSIGELVQGAVVTNLSNTDYVALTLKGTYKEVTVTGTDTTTTEIDFESPLDDRFAVQSGTSWLLRSMIDGRVDYTGLYQYNGGWRSLALRNLKKRQVVKIVTPGGSENADATTEIFDFAQGNGAAMLELNVGESTPAQLVYTVKAEGDVNLYLHRYVYINQIGVYESNANVADPKFMIASADENGTNVEIATETPDAFVFFRQVTTGQLPEGTPEEDFIDVKITDDPDPTHTHPEWHYLPADSTWTSGGHYDRHWVLLEDGTYGWDSIWVTDSHWHYTGWETVEVQKPNKIYVGTYWAAWQRYTAPVVVKDSVVIEAYAWYQDVESDIVRDTIYANYDLAVTQPVIESVVNGVVTISADNSGLDLSVNVAKPTSTIWYQLPGGEPAIYGAPIELPAGTYGWMQAWAEAPGFETSTKAWRYLDGREAYNEAYAWVVAETEAVPAAVTGDLELANVHELNAATTAVTPAGRIYLHKKVTENYNSLVLPFAYNNTTIVTDAKGNVLERGVDFKIFNMTTAGSGNRTNDTSMETLLDALDEERTANLTANTGAYLLQILNSDLVGEDIIFVSTAGVSLSARNAPSYTAREEGWQIVVNNTLEPQTVGIKAYHLNETGTAYVLDENFVAAPLTSVIITEAAFAAANPEIPLMQQGPTYLEIAQTLIFIPTEAAVADAVAAGWMEHGGTFTNNKTLTVNPETEEDEQTKSAPGLGIKAGNSAKSAAFYVKGANEVRSFATSTGSADRTMVVTATPSDGTDAVSAQATTSTTTAIIPLALDAAKSYKIEFASYDESGAGADMVIHAVKFVKNGSADAPTGLDQLVIEDTDVNIVYDLAGRRVDTLVKGQIYIQNGKRFMVK